MQTRNDNKPLDTETSVSSCAVICSLVSRRLRSDGRVEAPRRPVHRLPEQATSPTFPLPGRVQQTHQHSDLPTQALCGLERVTVGTGRIEEQAELMGR